jgi:2-methylcitrate dehydratase PrpD
VEVRLDPNGANTVNDREMPDISLQQMMAVMLLDKTVTFQAAHDTARMKDPALARERAKIQLMPDEELQRAYPKRVTTVDVILNDGTRLTERVEAVRGTAENPMPRQEVVAKCRDLMAPVLGTASTGQLIARVMELEKCKDIRELRPLLQA